MSDLERLLQAVERPADPHPPAAEAYPDDPLLARLRAAAEAEAIAATELGEAILAAREAGRTVSAISEAALRTRWAIYSRLKTAERSETT